MSGKFCLRHGPGRKKRVNNVGGILNFTDSFSLLQAYMHQTNNQTQNLSSFALGPNDVVLGK